MLKDIIKDKKSERNWSNQQLADAANLPVDTVNKILAGITKNPNTDTLMRIANALDCTLGELLGEVVNKSEQKKEGGSDMQTAMEIIRETYESRIRDMQKNLDKSEMREERLRREQYILVVFIFALIALIIYLIVDALHGNWGFFRYDDLVQSVGRSASQLQGSSLWM